MVKPCYLHQRLAISWFDEWVYHLWTTLFRNNNPKAPVCFLLLYSSRTNVRNYGPQTEVDGDRTFTYYCVMSISKFVKATSRTPTQKEELKWAHLSFWELENDMRKSLFRYERCQTLPAGKEKKVYVEIVRNGNICISLWSLQFDQSPLWLVASGQSPHHVRQHNPQAPTVSKREKLHHRKEFVACKDHTPRGR